MRAAAGQLTILVVALLAVTAGCQSPSGTAPETEPKRTETLSPGEHNGTGTSASSNNTVSSGSADDTESTGSVDPPTFFDTHERTLRQAGSVMVFRSQVRVSSGNETLPNPPSTIHEIDFDSGRVLKRTQIRITDTPSRPRYRYTYRNESGALFHNSDRPDWLARNQNGTIDVNAAIGLVQADAYRLTRGNQESFAGVNGTVYVLDSFEALDSDTYDQFDPVNVTDFRVTYVVDDSGYVRYQQLNMSVERGENTTTIYEELEFERVGAWEVPDPDWAT